MVEIGSPKCQLLHFERFHLDDVTLFFAADADVEMIFLSGILQELKSFGVPSVVLSGIEFQIISILEGSE